MPHTDLHKKKIKKNFAVLGLIFGWVALIFIISMIKVSNGG